MPQSHAQVWIHLVFSTKNRRTFLQEPTFQDEMFRMLSHQVKKSKCISASVGGHVDHAHLLVGLSRTISIAQLVENIKIETSKWAKKSEQGTTDFSWQSGYGAFSVSHSLLDTVDRYIHNQAEHHAGMSFQDEYRQLCVKHEVDIDEQYVWD